MVGDLMLDQYLWGKMERISPEAPVPIVDIERRERRLGGAANAGLNLQVMGAQCTLCGIVGQDAHGANLRELGQEAGLDMSLVLAQKGRKTTQKTRIICDGQQVLRVDEEVRDPIAPSLEEQLWNHLSPRIPTFDGIVFSDYDKGFLGRSLIQKIIQAAKSEEIPTMVDPKFRNFWDYEDCTLFKPNMKELNAGLKSHINKGNLEGIKRAIQQMQHRMPHTYSLITLSEHGMVWAQKGGELHHLEAHRREIIDVSGAGDAVMAIAALALAGGFSIGDAVNLANIAGGLVCEEVGVAPIRPERLLSVLTSAK